MVEWPSGPCYVLTLTLELVLFLLSFQINPGYGQKCSKSIYGRVFISCTKNSCSIYMYIYSFTGQGAHLEGFEQRKILVCNVCDVFVLQTSFANKFPDMTACSILTEGLHTSTLKTLEVRSDHTVL